MSILAFVINDIERTCIRTHDPEYEACPLEERYNFIKARIDKITPYELLEYQVKYQQFQSGMTPITPEAMVAVKDLAAVIRLLEGHKDPRAPGLLRAFRDLLNSLILE